MFPFKNLTDNLEVEVDRFSYVRCTGKEHLNTISEVAGYMMESNNDFRFITWVHCLTCIQ